MSQQTAAGPAFDLEQYRQNTRDLVASMNETTELIDEMSENMGRLGECFEAFGESKSQLRKAREELERTGALSGPAASNPGHAAD